MGAKFQKPGRGIIATIKDALTGGPGKRAGTNLASKLINMHAKPKTSTGPKRMK